MLPRNTRLPQVHECLEQCWRTAIERVAIVPIAQCLAKHDRIRVRGLLEPPHKWWTDALGTTTLEVVLERDRALTIRVFVIRQHLMQPRGAVAGAPAAIERVRVVVGRHALVRAGDVSPWRIDHARQCLKRNVALPGISRIIGLTVATHCSSANRHAPRALIADAASGVCIAEVEDGHRPVAEGAAKRLPVGGAAHDDGRAHVVEMLLAHPPQCQRRTRDIAIDGRNHVVDDRASNGGLLSVSNGRVAAHRDLLDTFLKAPPGVAVAVQLWLRGVHLLSVQVARRSGVVGDAPGDAAICAKPQTRYAGMAGARGVIFGPMHGVLVPARWHPERLMRVTAQQTLSRSSA